VFSVEPIDDKDTWPWTIICEIDGGLWVSSSDFDDFKRIFFDEPVAMERDY
jgi:hypothetical protein